MNRASCLIGRSIAAVALTGSVLLAGTTYAAADQTEVSHDGRNWSAGLDRPLFDRKWVPGETEQRTFWVRNAAGTDADLTLAVETPGSGWPAASSVLQVEVRNAAGEWVHVAPTGQPRELAISLAPGEEWRVSVRVTFSSEAGNEHQGLHAPLNFRATLTDDEADGNPTPEPTRSPEPTDGPDGSPGPPSPGPTLPGPSQPWPTHPGTTGPDDRPTDQPGDGTLPGTGAPAVLWLLPLGAGAIGLGAALLRRNDRRDGRHR